MQPPVHDEELNRAIALIEGMLTRKMDHAKHEADDMKRGADEIKRGLDLVMSNPTNLNHVSSLRGMWDILDIRLRDLYQTGADINGLERGLRVLWQEASNGA